MADLRLVIFDVDGTLVDSQAEIMAAMHLAFEAEGLPAPPRAAVLAIVGLSLAEAFLVLCPHEPAARQGRLVRAYKDAFNHLRGPDGMGGESPLYPGMAAVLQQFHAQDFTLLAVATGKSKRGLEKMIAQHALDGMFASQQVADFHPSKPHPAMVQAALSETGVHARQAVMIGDTSFDIDMGRAAGVRTIAVNWGYHAAEGLNADMIVKDANEILPAVDRLLGTKR